MSTIASDCLNALFPQLASRLGEDDLQALAAAFRVHEADAGEALVSEATWSDELFLVCAGRLDIALEGRDQAHHLAELSPGSMFGDVALLDPAPAGATVFTSEGATLLRMTRERFDRLHGAHPLAAAALLGEVLRSLAARLGAARARVQPRGASAHGAADGLRTPNPAGGR
jgi:SulP family sulfate permease